MKAWREAAERAAPVGPPDVPGHRQRPAEGAEDDARHLGGDGVVGEQRGEHRLVAQVEQGPEDADAEGPADLQGGVAGGRAHPGLGQRQRPHHRLGGRGHGQAGPDPEEDEGRHQVRVGGGGGGPRQQPQGDGDAEHAPGHHRLGPEAPGQHHRQRRHHQQHQGDRPDPQPGLERVVAQGELEVLGHQEEHAEQGEQHQGQGGDGGAEPAHPEELEREHRVVGVPLPQDEGGDHHRGPRQGGDHRRRGPRPAGGLDDPPEQQGQAHRRQQRPRHVERTGHRVARVGDQPDRRHARRPRRWAR